MTILEGGLEGHNSAAKTHKEPLVALADYKAHPQPKTEDMPKAFGPTPPITDGNMRVITPPGTEGKDGEIPRKRSVDPRADVPPPLKIKDNLPTKSEGAPDSLFKDDPTKSPADRVLSALGDAKANGALTPEHRKAFEDAIKTADAEMANGGSPRLPELQAKLAGLDKKIADPNFKADLAKKEADLQSQVDLLPHDKALQFQLFTGLRDAGMGDANLDKQINDLFAKKDGKTFLDQLKDLTDMASIPKDAARLKGQTIPLEQAENSFTRVAYALALLKSGNPADLSLAKQMVEKAITIKPDLQTTDPATKALMKKLGIGKETPL